jgi:MYXO-CTERM domain-containing protein
VVVEGNVIYDPANSGGSDLIDSVRPGELDIIGNIFWGNPSGDQSQSFITIKRESPVQGTPRSPRYRIRRNIFLNYGGATDQAFIQLGEDGTVEPEIVDCLIENNLFIGNSPAQMAAPMQFKGPRQVRVQFNTVVGDQPSGAYGFRVGTEGDNPTIRDIWINNNIFSDPTGSMGTRLFNAYGDVDLGTVELLHNLYWNGGSALPTGGDIPISADTEALEADPGLETDQSGLVLPRWDPTTGTFDSGTTSIDEEFLRLVEAYGALPAGSPAIDAASGEAPPDDIRGLARDTSADLGAYEHGASDPQPGPDSGVGQTDGGGTAGDAGPGTDAGSSNGQGDDGCGCRAGLGLGGAASWLMALLMLGLLGFRSRRQRR